MIWQYKIEDNKLITGSGKVLLEGFTEFTTSFDEEGNEIFPVEMQPYLEAERLEQNLQEAKQAKEETLKKLTVTLSDGKVFYADAESRIDLRDAIELGIELNQTSTAWKLAEDFNGSRIVEVTIDELKEASKLALMTKGNIVGAI